MLPVYHFYHCFADGAWQVPAGEHAAALRGSGFTADRITVGLVGGASRAGVARDWFTCELAGMGPLAFVTAETGFEQVTLRALHAWARGRDGEAACLYAHTKGAFNPQPVTTGWRRAMTAEVAGRWRDCVQLLGEYDAAGVAWQKSPWYGTSFFAGNFWWARASYLARLPDVPRDLLGALPPGETGDNRWDAEAWIGLGDPAVRNLGSWRPP
jgi:hypothetical protein